MSRRLLILITALSVCAYFGVIVLILSPLSHVGSPLYASEYMQKYGRRAASVQWCKELRWRSPAARGAVALASFPGSGNTWLRYLLQQLTGIVTGSIYMDYGLRLHGFPAENVTDGSVLVVKTHEPPPSDPDRFIAAILLIRNPRDAILADYNWLHKGHIGTAPKSAFRKKSPMHRNTEWGVWVVQRVAAWRALHRAWLRFPRALLAVRYERLVAAPRAALSALLAFLNLTAAERDVACTLARREGIYRRRRKHPDFDPFTPAMYRLLAAARQEVDDLLRDYARRHNDTAFLL